MREGVLRVLDSISAPAYVRNNRMDVLAANRLGRSLFADVYAEGATGFNLARYLFLDPRSRDFYTQWDIVARDSVAALRIEAGYGRSAYLSQALSLHSTATDHGCRAPPSMTTWLADHPDGTVVGTRGAGADIGGETGYRPWKAAWPWPLVRKVCMADRRSCVANNWPAMMGVWASACWIPPLR